MTNVQTKQSITRLRASEIERVIRRAPYPLHLRHVGNLRFVLTALLLASALVFSALIVTDPNTPLSLAAFCVVLTASWAVNTYHAHVTLKLRRLEWIRSQLAGR